MSSTDYSIFTALEREIGRARLRAMAEAYLAATVPGSFAGFAAGGAPVTPPGFDYGPPVPAPRTYTLGAPPPSIAPVGLSPFPSPVLGPLLSGLESPPATPPSRRMAAPAEPPGAPARLGRDSRGGLGLMQWDAHDDLYELRRTDPANPLLCPRHRHIPLNLPLGPSRNSTGGWGLYVPPGTNCRICQAEDAADGGSGSSSGGGAPPGGCGLCPS